MLIFELQLSTLVVEVLYLEDGSVIEEITILDLGKFC